ncbi:hypothetical protein E0F26_01065 [Candidatus Paraluminiphilus aquimaris]|uniref:Secreted protein n=1 Tax=Candidatus Paraluminiphilus aquimaris TaxID=2518994 RepID=A0ABY6Q478_9GAMM|nr:hypothetical protein [Candidatus Paraluminiphilus aquimaris]UZP73409.1 hypothetical protein E0F26_01065 [Candidatus Paraluminiphilus aquimaris]
MKSYTVSKDQSTQFLAAIAATLGLVATSSTSLAEQDSLSESSLIGAQQQEARLLSAFFGLDNNLPFAANRLCWGASGEDGMPVVFSQTLDADTLQPEDFEVTSKSGEAHTPKCVTLRPAQDAGELRTVLLIGEFGDAPDNPPLSAKVVGELLSDGSPTINFKGTHVDVTPLAEGPSLVLAEPVPKKQWTQETNSTRCPQGVRQIIRVTWNGGVRRPDRGEAGEAERKLYRVEVQQSDGFLVEVTPIALAELGDRDNNHFLCLDTGDPAVAVSFPEGRLVDPNGDLNPYTAVRVSTSGR